MVLGEAYDETALRHVREQEARILRHRGLIERLAATGEPTDLAEQILRTMERTLDIMRMDLDRRRR